MQLRSVKHKPKTEQGKQHRKLMQARLKSSKAAKVSHPYIRWTAIKDTVTCRSCLDLDGRHFSVVDPVWKDCLPPTHDGCRCRISSARKLPDGIFVEALSEYFDVLGVSA